MSAPAAKALSLPVMTNRADAGVAVEALERAAQLRHERGAERVQLLRPVKRDHAHPALLLYGETHSSWVFTTFA